MLNNLLSRRSTKESSLTRLQLQPEKNDPDAKDASAYVLYAHD